MIYELLGTGRQNALSQEYLRIALGMQSKREVRKQVEIERQEGRVILSCMDSPGGYFKPANVSEVREYVKTFETRAKRSLLNIRSARKLLKEADGKEEFDL